MVSGREIPEGQTFGSSVNPVGGDVEGERGSDIIFDIMEPVIDGEDAGCINSPSSICSDTRY